MVDRGHHVGGWIFCVLIPLGSRPGRFRRRRARPLKFFFFPPAALFEKFPRKDVFITNKEGR